VIVQINGIKYRYKRVSSREQNPARQNEALLKAGIEEGYIFIDKKSGKKS
jgi:DNA invertase Pin-like site-specific DNA recombinase